MHAYTVTTLTVPQTPTLNAQPGVKSLCCACTMSHHSRECRQDLQLTHDPFAMQSAVLGFGVFRVLERYGITSGLSVAENVILQTTSVATATMPLAAGDSTNGACQLDFNRALHAMPGHAHATEWSWLHAGNG